MNEPQLHVQVSNLIERSHRLGADRRNTNYGGGNTSCKAEVPDPTSGADVSVLFVKGSGGDLGTLTSAGLAMLRLDRVRGLTTAYRGEQHEDEMVGLFDHCAFGAGGAAPSIDTAMHALLESAHVDHLHPDSVIALAASADGEQLTKECFGDEVGWLPWRRPGFELGLEIARMQENNPQMRGVVLGGHGLTTWAATSDECEQTSVELIRRAAEFIVERGRPAPFGEVVPGRAPLPEQERRERAAALLPVIRGLASRDRRMVGHFTDSDEVLDFLSRECAPRLVALGTSCPDHFLRTKVRPLLLDLDATAPLDVQISRLRELHEEYRAEYTAYYERHRLPDSPPMRGADPAIVLVPGVGMFSFGIDKQTARVAGEFYVNAINVMRGAEALSTYAPVPESEKFRIEYWLLEELKLQRRPKPRPLSSRVAVVTGGASGIGLAVSRRLAAEGACVVVADRNIDAARKAADDLGGPDVCVAVEMDVSDEAAVQVAMAEAVLAFGGVDLVVQSAGLSISKPLVDTDVGTWDLQYDVMPRGSFLVSRTAARQMIDQGLGGDIVYIVSKNAVVAGPANVAYGSAKAAQAHQVRLLATDLGEHGIRVNGVNPDGVVSGSGIFASGWAEQRAAVYGVPVDKLGEFYAQRTLLKQEVLPDHVASAVFALISDDLSLTTGTIIPVDGGVPAAFLR